MSKQAQSTREQLRLRTRQRFADNLRAHRRRLRLTQERAAEKVGFSLQYLQRIERCIPNVPMDTISRFAAVFGVDPADLLREPNE
jgi:transcriptional regulator with XRE-family HTH domain